MATKRALAIGIVGPGNGTTANGAGVATATLVVRSATGFKVGDIIIIATQAPVAITVIAGLTFTLAATRTWADNDPVFHATSSPPLDASTVQLDGCGIYVYGTFVGTYSIEGSTDGGTWFPLDDNVGIPMSGLTGPGLFIPAGECRQLRINCTAYTSGTIQGAAVVAESN